MRWLFLACVLLATAVQAQTYRWVDKDGKVHFGDRPPPTAARAQERKAGATAADTTPAYAVRQAMANYPVTLYVAASCAEGCKDGRAYLAKRGIPFAEKNVANDEEIEALKKLTGGLEAVVPVLAVGSKLAKGWQREDWQRLLDAAGYPKE